MAKLSIENTTLTAIGDAIRERDKTTEPILANEFANRIKAIPSGSGLPSYSGEFNPAHTYGMQNITLYDNMTPLVVQDGYQLPQNTTFIPAKSDGTPLLDTSNVTNMNSSGDFFGSMFNQCSDLKTIPQLNTSSVTNMYRMFSDCGSLTTIPLLDTSKVTDMTEMFWYCKRLTTIPLLDTSKVTNMDSMFDGCGSLTSIPLLDTSKVTNMDSMFDGCGSLTSIPLLDTSKVTNMDGMFDGCINLTTIPILNTSKVTDMDNMFDGCRYLSDEGLKNILMMCKNAKVLPAEKKRFSYNYSDWRPGIGLSETQLDHIKATPELKAIYDELETAGWTDR